MSAHTRKGRRAVTRWRVVERFRGWALLAIAPETGRTHQIRAHLASVGLPVAGDQVYGKPGKKTEANMVQLKKVSEHIKRQALHAAILGFIHPGTLQYVEFFSPLPEDMAQAIGVLRETKSPSQSSVR